MNWYVHKVIGEVKQSDIDRALDGHCDHVKVGTKAHLVGEQDSFGPVTRFLYCTECYNKAKEEEGNEPVFCDDCGKEVPKKNTFEWRWYGFYAPQGDEPLIICKDCKGGEKHKKRVEADESERALDYDLDDDDNYYGMS